jgi:hypothetical protein
VTDPIVVGDRVLLDIGFPAARARLAILAGHGLLLAASEEAYGEAITGLVQLAGPAAGLTRLAGVGLDYLAETGHCAHIALRWEAIALALAGAHRPQPGPAGAGMDRAIVRRCAAATSRSFVTRVGCALAHPAGTARPAGRSAPRRPLRGDNP